MWHIDDSIHDRRHFSEQYLTWSQSLRHFFRHSNSRPQVTHFLGAIPFLTLATRGVDLAFIIGQLYLIN
jgi:hypothetical protein